jgi:hypothetical protein
VTTLTRYKLSQHAKKRRKQMRVTEDRIESALADPELVYPCDRRKYNESRMLYQREDIVVVVDEDTAEVITVLWHRKEGR